MADKAEQERLHAAMLAAIADLEALMADPQFKTLPPELKRIADDIAHPPDTLKNTKPDGSANDDPNKPDVTVSK